MEAQTKATRKASSPVKVYCLPQERKALKEGAKGAGLSLSTYLLKVGLGYRVQGILDNKRVEELAKINGDLGRLGGLLKLWLTNDHKTAHIGPSTIRAVLSKIEDAQTEMITVMRAVVMPRASQEKKL